MSAQFKNEEEGSSKQLHRLSTRFAAMRQSRYFSQGKQLLSLEQDILLRDETPSLQLGDNSPVVKQQMDQLKKIEKEETTNRMIQDFKLYISIQQNKRGEEQYPGNSTNSLIGSPKKNNKFGRLASQTSLVVSDRSEEKDQFDRGDDSPQFLQSSNQSQFQISSQSPNQKRHNSIAKIIQDKLKIHQKSREQRFNEKLKVFKDVSTFIETKEFMQNLNVLNQRKEVEKIKKVSAQKIQYLEAKSRLKISTKKINSKEDMCEREGEGEGEDEEKKIRVSKNKYSIQNKKYDTNLNSLLDLAFKNVNQNKERVIQMELNKSDKVICQSQQNIVQQVLNKVSNHILERDGFHAYQENDQNQFFDQLRVELINDQKKCSDQEYNKALQNTLTNEQQKEIIDTIYNSQHLIDTLSQEEIQSFVQDSIQKKDEPFSALSKKYSKSLYADLTTNLDSKYQYQEYNIRLIFIFFGYIFPQIFEFQLKFISLSFE